MRTFLRLAWRLQRWEVAVLIGGTLLLTAAVAYVAWQTSVTNAGLEACYANASGAPPTADCQSLIEAGNRWSRIAPTLTAATTVVPFIVGILLGAPLVSRELEKRTASIAWSLSLSRTRWLVIRVAPILVAITIALLLLGQASEALIRATPPGQLSFPSFAMHGPLIAVRGLAIFCIGILVGLMMGRVLPAILVTGVAAIALVAVLTLARDQMMRAEATWVPVGPEDDLSGVMIYDSAFIDDATGERISFDEAYRRYPEVFDAPPADAYAPGLTQVYLETPPELYPVFVVREIDALLVISAFVAGASVWVLRSRHPDLG
jgi:hypothetical protein